MEVCMPEPTDRSASASLPLPDAPNLDWLRKQAKRHLDELRQAQPEAKLADAQFGLAQQYGFSSWRALKAHVDSLTVDGQLFAAARSGDVAKLATLLDAQPDRQLPREKPYDHTLLHAAAQRGRTAVVEFLLARGTSALRRGMQERVIVWRSEEHTSELQSHSDLVCRLLLAKKKR